MARRRRRRGRWGRLAAVVLVIAAAALAWMLWPDGDLVETFGTREREPAAIAPSAPRETLEERDREALRDLLERKQSR